MSYTYLPDGTLFTPEAINDRLAVVEGQLNSLTSSNLAHGALRHEHLPTVFDSATKNRVITKQFVRDFDNPLAFPKVPRTGDHSLQGAFHTYDDTIDFDAEGITAVLVMFNLNVNAFVYPNQDGTFSFMNTTQKTRNHLAWEDYMGAFFHVRLRTGASENDLLRSRRGISPGFAMADVDLTTEIYIGSASDLSPQGALSVPGMNMTNDFHSHKDFALRTVILKEDLPGGVLNHLEIVGRVKPLATDRATYPIPKELKDIRILYSKWNLTVIPIYSEIKLTTGV
tara:strand:- start:25536 stop:26384 length:849 start_codon:yes stop_codon:yes gene_type:complete